MVPFPPIGLNEGLEEMKLVVFRLEGSPPEQASVKIQRSVPIFTRAEVKALQYLQACIGQVWPADEDRAMPVVIRAMQPGELPYGGFWRRYDIAVYRLAAEALTETIRVASSDPPWIGDLGGDGTVEIVTWQRISDEPELFGSVPPWPIVRTLVDGQYQVRTEQFPSLFVEVAAALQRVDEHMQMGETPRGLRDPRVPEYLARAYELLGETGKATAARKRAQRR
jgi:hypothetical protein